MFNSLPSPQALLEEGRKIILKLILLVVMFNFKK